MDDEIGDLLYAMPANALEYADDLTDLDVDDIPCERIPRMKEMMRQREDEYHALRAGIVLASWGDEDGFAFLESFVCERSPSCDVLMPHRLHSWSRLFASVHRPVMY